MARWTLRAKWTSLALGIAVVPMVVLGLVVLDIQRRGLARAEKELEAAVVDEAAGSVMASLDQAPDVAARVNALFSDQTIDADARTRLIGDVVARAPAVQGVAFFDSHDAFVDAVVAKDTPLDTDLAVLRAPPTGAPTALRYETAIVGPVRGTLVVALSRAFMDAKLRDLSQVRFGAPDRVYLVDELRRGEHRFSASIPSFANELLLTTELRDDDGIEKVGTVRTMPRQHLALVVERPKEEAFAALASARRAFFASVVALAAFASLVALLAVRRVLAPIGALMQLVARYGRRELSARSDIHTGDELEDLGRSLEQMADDLSGSDREIAKRARIEANLKRYLPSEAAEAAARGEGALDLGGARRKATILFADVVAFTGFAERATPEKAVAFLNELFTILSEVVFRHDGMVDKFIGDCVMAVFRDGDHAARALATAEDMHAFVESNQPRWREAYGFEVRLGIGVSCGEVLLGNLGSETRMEYTVIGDAVNVAARLEMLARPKQTLATKDVVLACPSFSFASLGEHALRGKAQPVEVFEVTP